MTISPPPAAPSRARAVLVLVFIAVVVIGVIAGLVLVLADQFAGHTTGHAAGGPTSHATTRGSVSPPANPDSGKAARDALAKTPMMSLPESDANPQPLAASDPNPPLAIPAATTTAHAGGTSVPTGFPHTPEGALAQLTAIDEAAISGADTTRLRQVHQWASMPGAVSLPDWNLWHLLNGLSGEVGGDATSTYQVSEGIVKGSVGDDYAVVCVLGEWDVTAGGQTVRRGIGDCQRMAFTGGQWRIGPGSQPAYAPSAWPGSPDAVRAGWREVKRG
jgi:hypothetical protein